MKGLRTFDTVQGNLLVGHCACACCCQPATNKPQPKITWMVSQTPFNTVRWSRVGLVPVDTLMSPFQSAENRNWPMGTRHCTAAAWPPWSIVSAACQQTHKQRRTQNHQKRISEMTYITSLHKRDMWRTMPRGVVTCLPDPGRVNPEPDIECTRMQG